MKPSSMSRPLMAGVGLGSTLLMTIGCVPPPRVAGIKKAAGRQSAESSADALLAPLLEPEAT